ncbi:unnamed protein product (macronuclear) [Paramecium tetraurelia]|uniref:Autophagy-related protein n=1 Tax=Paramecium tetraurelia TaxID=5888 RepID=A0CRP1_PARTE|nr:uncharacterized protein GSPATT00009773001 [Paramecium tetraurelia]CAK73458.1 unnamed protein product [Paramecium tetraurelia]|eukprot:XP_001440855.1 hypothetical protein (macronuclear) [Paramecium tetraurelia strain d4-2]
MNAQTKSSFKERHTLEERIKLYQTKQLAYPSKILIILEQFIDSSSTSQLQQQHIIKRCAADPEQLMVTFEGDISLLFKKKIPKAQHISLFFFINNVLPQKDQTMGQLQKKMQDQEDGFLYIQVKSLETLGSL